MLDDLQFLLSRRQWLAGVSGSAIASAWVSRPLIAGLASAAPGVVVGEPTAEKAGMEILATGGNAIDAIVAAALAAGVAAPWQTGFGGYGGCLTLARSSPPAVTCIDFNSRAPAALTADAFLPGPDGKVPGNKNTHGWLAAGVPGIPAGLQLALDRYGRRSFGDVIKPAIRLAREGIPVDKSLAGMFKNLAPMFRADAGSRGLYLKGEEPLSEGDVFKNEDLADLLSRLAEEDSTASFYRGETGRRIAAAFQANGGLVTEEDMASYEAREVAPIALQIGDWELFTVPPPAGGLTVLQALGILQALDWAAMPPSLARTQAQVEALRFTWRDRLTLLGDPEQTEVPIERLLSGTYADEAAERVRQAVQTGRPIDHDLTPRPQSGTISLSAADGEGNLAALTLTHGESFGARVTVDGLGLTLGHGMVRFETLPGHPNSPGPRKRPLHNMCPTIVRRAGQPVLAIGGRGGRRIPNSLFQALTHFVLLGRSLEESVAAPRMHTEGSLGLDLEKSWPEEEARALAGLGYAVKTGTAATLSAVRVDAEFTQLARAMR
jgi:gamma-glutamyltranspeptidase/glutathione hydrolase